MNNVEQLFPETDAQADRFEEFWKTYPHCRRERKMLAKAKFDAITSGGLATKTLDKDSGLFVEIELKATAEEIIEGAKKYDRRMRNPHQSWEYRDGGKYICHPATWLNQGRWMDEA